MTTSARHFCLGATLTQCSRSNFADSKTLHCGFRWHADRVGMSEQRSNDYQNSLRMLATARERRSYAQNVKRLWCWRCKIVVPMLEDDEFKRLTALRGSGEYDLRSREFGPVLAEYERLTGFHETNVNAIYHHVTSLYGPLCRRCGKPLRSPKAKLCGGCMEPA
jgi:hypothetical protein